MNEGYRVWRALKRVLSTRGLGIKAKKCNVERRKVYVSEMKCLRSLVRVSRMDRVRNEYGRRRAV